MKQFFSVLLLCPWLALSAWSQAPPQPVVSPVQQYLGLTGAQVAAIRQNNNDYNTFSIAQQRLIQNAQYEIATETAKDQLDPLAIGTLYAGIENACRDLRDKASALQQQNVSILTDAQKVKLNLLNDAMKLAPTIADAQSWNLLGSPPPAYSLSGFVSYAFGFPQVSGCASFPLNIIPASRIAPTGERSVSR
jgi:hypothetical protein